MRMRQLKDGETKEIRKYKHAIWNDHKRFKVFAHRVDCDTPYVILKFYDRNGNEHEFWLEDCYSIDLIGKVQQALDILPTSK